MEVVIRIRCCGFSVIGVSLFRLGVVGVVVWFGKLLGVMLGSEMGCRFDGRVILVFFVGLEYGW